MTGAVNRACDCLDVVDDERGVRLAGRREVLLDADVQLQAGLTEPDATTSQERRRFGHLGKPQHTAIEGPSRLLSADGAGDLYVVQPHAASSGSFIPMWLSTKPSRR